MNRLENHFFQKETLNEITRQLSDILKKFEEVKSLESLSQHLSEESTKIFRKALMYIISLSSEEIQSNSKELQESIELVREKEEANQKILLKILDFKAFLDSYS